MVLASLILGSMLSTAAAAAPAREQAAQLRDPFTESHARATQEPARLPGPHVAKEDPNQGDALRNPFVPSLAVARAITPVPATTELRDPFSEPPGRAHAVVRTPAATPDSSGLHDPFARRAR